MCIRDRLTELRLYNNQLTGSIPPELGHLGQLNLLDLSSNQLTGCIPDNFSIYCNISYNLENNPSLSWQGDMQRFCNGESQIGVTCDDENPNTQDDQIQEDCTCRGTSPVNECRMRDSLALVALYEATDGANWTNTWDLTQPIQTWFGVRTNTDGCVDNLDLDGNNDARHSGLVEGGNNLRGTIPAAIGQFLDCLLYTSPSPRDATLSRMPSSA